MDRQQEVENRIAVGMGMVIDLLRSNGYTPREVHGICMSLMATIAMNYLSVPEEKMCELMQALGEGMGIDLKYTGSCLNPVAESNEEKH